jgi:hypothetical protein
MRWAIEIQKTSLDKRNLSDLLSNIGFRLIEGIDHPAITSTDIDSCLTAKYAYEKVKHVRNIIKEITQFDQHFELGSVIDYSVDPPCRQALFEANITSKSTIKANLTSSIENLSPSEIENYEDQQYKVKLNDQLSILIPAYSNPNAVKVIELLSLDPQTGESLYKIYELMESHPNNRDKFQKDLNITKETFNRFGSAVHNPSVTGDWARHAYDKKPVPNPMTKSEAEEFIRNLANKWFESIRREFEKRKV